MKAYDTKGPSLAQKTTEIQNSRLGSRKFLKGETSGPLKQHCWNKGPVKNMNRKPCTTPSSPSQTQSGWWEIQENNKIESKNHSHSRCSFILYGNHVTIFPLDMFSYLSHISYFSPHLGILIVFSILKPVFLLEHELFSWYSFL